MALVADFLVEGRARPRPPGDSRDSVRVGPVPDDVPLRPRVAVQGGVVDQTHGHEVSVLPVAPLAARPRLLKFKLRPQTCSGFEFFLSLIILGTAAG